MCVGAYIGCFCANYMHAVIPSKLAVLVISMLIGGISAAVFGLIIGLPCLRLKGDYLAIVTLAFGEIVRTVFMNQPVFGGALGLTTQKYGKNLYIIAFVVVLFTVFVSQNLMRSKHGRAIQSIRDNEIASRAMGVNVTYYKLINFRDIRVFQALRELSNGHNTTPVDYSFFSFNYSIEILVMVVLGGMGNISGSIISAAVLTFINVKLQTQLSGDLAALKQLIYALILIVMVMWNNAPALRGIREKVNIRSLIDFFTEKVLKKQETAPEGGIDPPASASWDKIPTKIPMDAILSTDITPDNPYEADPPKKEEKR